MGWTLNSSTDGIHDINFVPLVKPLYQTMLKGCHHTLRKYQARSGAALSGLPQNICIYHAI